MASDPVTSWQIDNEIGSYDFLLINCVIICVSQQFVHLFGPAQMLSPWRDFLQSPSFKMQYISGTNITTKKSAVIHTYISKTLSIEMFIGYSAK